MEHPELTQIINKALSLDPTSPEYKSLSNSVYGNLGEEFHGQKTLF